MKKTMSQIIHFLLKILDLIYLMLFMRTISTLYLSKEIKILFNNFSISNDNHLNIEKILIDNKNSYLISSLNTNFSNSDKFSLKLLRVKSYLLII